MNKMSLTVAIILLLSVLAKIMCITVSPELGYRNASIYLNHAKLNKSNENYMNLMADRYRRLIPYMTFYFPTDFPINQHYNNYMQVQQQQQQQQQPLPPPQQKQIIAIYQPQSHRPPQMIPQQEQQQQHHHQLRPTIYVQPRYPNQRPQYQTIMYKTRHQTNPGNNGPGSSNMGAGLSNIHDGNVPAGGGNHPQMPIPVSYKETVVKMPSYRPSSQYHHLVQPHQSTSKLNLSPFRPENKIPGDFTPIIYTDNGNSINYNAKPQIGNVKQYSEVSDLDELQRPTALLHAQNQNHQQHSPQSQRPNNAGGLSQNILAHGSILASTVPPPTSVSPIYTIVNNDQLQDERQSYEREPVIVQQQEQQEVNLTPEQRYVQYLRLKQSQKHQQQHHHQQQQEKKQPLLDHQPESRPQHFILTPSTTAAPDHYLYHEKQVDSPANQIVYQPPTAADAEEPNPQRILIYAPIQQQRTPQKSGHNFVRPDNQNYVQYVEQEQPQQLVKINEQIPNKTKYQYKPVIYVTTAEPLHATSSLPVYNRNPTHSHEQEEEYIEPIPKKTYLTPTPPTVHQHLTETTQITPPRLTTYHPTYATTKPKYSTYRPTIQTQKLNAVSKYKPIVIRPISSSIQKSSIPEEEHRTEPLPDIASSSLAEILRKLQESNHLPHTLTPDNIDNSIKTLVKILNNLKQSQTIVHDPPQHHIEEDYDYNDGDSDKPHSDDMHQTPGPNSGRPGIDYPALAEIPQTSFNCKEQRYKGFFGDPETNCQVWHYCDLNGGQASFLCPNGTIFSQVALTCDWWFNVKCSSTAQLYVLNERLYKYILPFTPKFPEDYSGPLVDKYLALKFKEMEEKMSRQKSKGKEKSKEGNDSSTGANTASTSSGDGNSSEQSSGEVNDDDDVDDHSSIDTGLPYTPAAAGSPVPSTIAGASPVSIQVPSSTPASTTEHIQAVIVSTTEAPLVVAAPTKMKTSVESEKIEVIEIKSDGTSGHLIPGQDYRRRK